MVITQHFIGRYNSETTTIFLLFFLLLIAPYNPHPPVAPVSKQAVQYG